MTKVVRYISEYEFLVHDFSIIFLVYIVAKERLLSIDWETAEKYES